LKPGILHTAHEVGGHGHHGDGGHGDGHGDAHGHAEHAAEHGADAGHHAAESVMEMGFSIPGLLELGTFIGFLSLFIFFVLNSLSSVSLTGENDPYIEESIHHHT